MDDKVLKIKFEVADVALENQLYIIITTKKENDKTNVQINIGPNHTLLEASPDIVSNIYFDVLRTIGKIKESFESGKGYSKVYALTESEFQDYIDYLSKK
jgi:hypothetical protein